MMIAASRRKLVTDLAPHAPARALPPRARQLARRVVPASALTGTRPSFAPQLALLPLHLRRPTVAGIDASHAPLEYDPLQLKRCEIVSRARCGLAKLRPAVPLRRSGSVPNAVFCGGPGSLPCMTPPAEAHFTASGTRSIEMNLSLAAAPVAGRIRRQTPARVAGANEGKASVSGQSASAR